MDAASWRALASVLNHEMPAIMQHQGYQLEAATRAADGLYQELDDLCEAAEAVMHQAHRGNVIVRGPLGERDMSWRELVEALRHLLQAGNVEGALQLIDIAFEEPAQHAATTPTQIEHVVSP